MNAPPHDLDARIKDLNSLVGLSLYEYMTLRSALETYGSIDGKYGQEFGWWVGYISRLTGRHDEEWLYSRTLAMIVVHVRDWDFIVTDYGATLRDRNNNLITFVVSDRPWSREVREFQIAELAVKALAMRTT